MKKLNISIIFYLLRFIAADDTFFFSNWRDYPACRLGRLQSPIEIKEDDSDYSNDFSFVYQNYNNDLNISINKTDNLNYALKTEDINNGGYINFERRGVIKQYKFIRAELYPGLHPINGDKSDYELHLVHKKNLEFITNKNNHFNIEDINMYLRVVLRYNQCSIVNSDDDELLNNLTFNKSVRLSNYPLFQDKRAYFYEGSSLNIPCDENVNYYVVNDTFCVNETIYNEFKDNLPFTKLNTSNIFDRPLYRNFKLPNELNNNSYYIAFKIISLISLFFYFF